jgi:hypothetical protein
MGSDNHVVVSQKLCGFQGRVGGCTVMMEQCGACSNFLLSLLANSVSDPNGVCEVMDCLTMVFVDEFLNFSNIFCCFAGAWSP